MAKSSSGEGSSQSATPPQCGEAPFELRDASVGGNGLRPELRDASWEELRDLAYEGRGA